MGTRTDRRVFGLGRLLLGAALACPVAGFAVKAEERVADFDAWIATLRAEALERSVSAETLDRMLDGIRPLERVIELDRNQPETSLTFAEYLDRVVTRARVKRGQTRARRHRALLERIHEKYGVQPRFIVALWGIETDYGRRTGSFSVIEALATLAWDGRRSAFFRGELLDALQIADEGHVAPSRMRGSWAGAMGQPQFMPSSFRRFAVDFDGDARRDIWDTTGDVLASAANYLAGSGWHGDQTWGREVKLPEGFDSGLVGLKVTRRMSQWRALGVRRADGSALPTRELAGSIVQPDGAQGPSYLVYDNYRALLKWNRSTYFATAVGLLSDRLE